MASVVIFRWSEEPSVEPMGRPRCTCVAVFIDYGLRAEWRQRVAIPIVRAFEDFVCRDGGIDARPTEEIDRVLYLWGKFIPKLNWEVSVGSS